MKSRPLVFLPAIVLFLLGFHSAKSQPLRSYNAAEVQLALKKLTVLGSVLYIAAHPDDENTAFLTYLTKGRLARAAYLSTTRGEGGQNLIGSEQGEQLGVIRTQELLAARRIDGAEQFFTRAIDFGYSKSSEEALRIWNKEEALADVVWVIRTFRPDVVVTRFSPTLGGHGHHTASGILAAEAFEAAGDPTKYPEQLQHVKVWRPKRLLFNYARFFTTPFDTARALRIDLGEYSPMLGRSFTEIAGESRSMHKSQGFGAAQGRGENINYFLHTAGDTARRDLFDGVNLTWSRIPGGDRVIRHLQHAINAFNPQQPSLILPTLVDAYSEMLKLPNDEWVEVKKRDLEEVIRACAGLWVEAITADSTATPGSEVKVTVTALNRSESTINLVRLSPPFHAEDTLLQTQLQYNKPLQVAMALSLPADFPVTQPYWMREPATQGLYTVRDRRFVGHPENPSPPSVQFLVEMYGRQIGYTVPIQYRWVDPVEGELYRPFEIVPALAANLDERIWVFTGTGSKSIPITLRAGEPNAAGRVRVLLPEGWSASPAEHTVQLARKSQEQIVSFVVKPSNGSKDGTFRVEVETEDGRSYAGIQTIRYGHIPSETLFPPAVGKLVRLSVQRKKKSIGYIMGPGDGVPSALRQLGYRITLLSDEDLASADLQQYETIVAGVRAYNTRSKLRVHNQRLIDYMNSGGTYVVQYATAGQDAANIGPYPFTISRERVSVEDAPVSFVDPAHPVLHTPNTITGADFTGWVQERGLYFADRWDSAYQPILQCNDPDEPARLGGLLVARHGRGYFVYTGYAFFRQLPAGVPGAYRLFVNLVELDGKTNPPRVGKK